MARVNYAPPLQRSMGRHCLPPCLHTCQYRCQKLLDIVFEIALFCLFKFFKRVVLCVIALCVIAYYLEVRGLCVCKRERESARVCVCMSDWDLKWVNKKLKMSKNFDKLTKLNWHTNIWKQRKFIFIGL